MTAEQVIRLAPDEASAKAGQQLATPAKWIVRSVHPLALWGECQGSGRTPYQTTVDLGQLAFKCSCPSRKFPCKHGLGLLLLYSRQPDVFSPETELPGWVADWLSKRQARETASASSSEKAEAGPADDAGRQKRADAREKKVTAGLEELRTWISDLVRTGIAGIPAQSNRFHQAVVSRMVDAQAGGVAAQLRQIDTLDFFRDGWQKALLKRLSGLYLLADAFGRRDTLPPDLSAELYGLIGWNRTKEEVLRGDAVYDHWTVLSLTLTDEDSLRVERIWLYGTRTGRFALVLQFYAGNQVPEHFFAPGQHLDAAVVYYPGLLPQRVLIRESQVLTHVPPVIRGSTRTLSVFQHLSEALAINPFLGQLPFLLSDVVLAADGAGWWLSDETGEGFPLANPPAHCWKLLAFSQGLPVSVFGVYAGGNFVLHSAWAGSETCFLL